MKKRMSKKGALELSVNTIVIVVIGITLLVLGLVFVRSIFTKLGGLGTEAFQQAEQELKQIQAGDTKINFPASIDVKKGKSSNPTLRICNTDGTLLNAKIELKVSEFPTNPLEALSVRVGDDIIKADGSITIPNSKIGNIEYQTCRPLPVLVNSNPSTLLDPGTQPYLTITVYSGTTVYDSIGTIINIT